MEKCAFHASSSGVVTGYKERKRLEGLALPFGVAASKEHPAFPRGVLVDYSFPRPLLLEHDIRQRIGVVESIFEKEDGVYFIAALDVEPNGLPQQVSVGGEYVVDGDKIVALYIYEVSLTATPAYEATFTNFVASRLMETKAFISKAETTQLKAQEEELLTRIQALEEYVASLSQQVQGLTTRIDKLEQALSESATTTDTIAEVQASLRKYGTDMMNLRADLLGLRTSIEKLYALHSEWGDRVENERKRLKDWVEEQKQLIADATGEVLKVMKTFTQKYNKT